MSSRASASSNPKFIELDILRSGDGIKAIISQRTSNNSITFCIIKEFERDGLLEATNFVPEAMIDSYEAMVRLVRQRIEELRRDPRIAPARATVSGRR